MINPAQISLKSAISTRVAISTSVAILAILCSFNPLYAQYSPGVGEAVSEAVSAGDEAIRSWAVSCSLERGPGFILFPDSIEVTHGEASFATGAAGNEVVSLGDGGRATLSFENPITNGPGPDFAVFENSFDGNFLELGFVEVSSDKERFVRFPSSSLTAVDSQIGPFGILDPENIHNLAGKYSSGWGTPFDLAELKDSAGLNINQVIAVRIIDVVGILNDSLGSRDAEGRLINDPFPTPWESGGFDLDAVGVLNSSFPGGLTGSEGAMPGRTLRGGGPDTGMKLYPNPCNQECYLEFQEGLAGEWRLVDLNGRELLKGQIDEEIQKIDLRELPDGNYVVQIISAGSRMQGKIIKNSR